ncbi:MAG: arylsulfatase A-like enzyme [Planctomycetota bacterium]|jgi:arylsulfatase A-like enzyme
MNTRVNGAVDLAQPASSRARAWPLGTQARATPLAYALVLALVTVSVSCSERAKPNNVLLIVIDTLRADHLSCYGYERDTSPRIDELAANGLRFTHAQAPRAKTTPSVATLMTGLYPQQHGLRDLTMSLRAGVPTLAEELKQAGYSTRAIVGNYVLKKELSALDRGFETWIEDLPETRGVPPDAVPQRSAASLTDGALELMGWSHAPDADSRATDEPFFLYLHYMDPHGLYDPPPQHQIFSSGHPAPIDTRTSTKGGYEARIATYNVPENAWLATGEVDAAAVMDLYDGEVHYVDHEIGRLLDGMRSAGELEHTWIVIVSDHGESMGEHRYWFEHGLYAFEATCRVPLIVVPPASLTDRPEAGVRHADLSLADLRPTLMTWLKLQAAVPEGRGPYGVSRADLLRADSTSSHPVFSEKVDRDSRERAIQTKAVRIGDTKLIRRYLPRAEPGKYRVVEQLFDLTRDPSEENDLLSAGVQSEAAQSFELLNASLEAFVRGDTDFEDLPRILHGKREALGRENPEALRVLEALGY